MTYISQSTLAGEASADIHNSGGLGACVLASDVPFSGMGLDIFNRRVQGVSWKSIADEFNLGTPSKARNTFTKLTGITDYQVKGPQLMKLAQGGLDEALTLSKKVKAAQVAESKANKALSVTPKQLKNYQAKAIDDAMDKLAWQNESYSIYLKSKGLSEKQIDFILGGHHNLISMADLHDIYEKMDMPIPKPVADYMKALKIKGKALTDAPDIKVLHDPGWTDTDMSQEIYDLHKQGNGYLKIQQQTGTPMPEIDKTIWNSLLKDNGGDVWKAYKAKPGSQEGFDAVKQMIFDQRKAGKTISEIVDLTDVDPKVVKAIVDGNWKLPAPGTNQYYVPPSYSPSPSAGSYASKQDWGNDEFPRLSPAEMVKQGDPLSENAKASLQKYTGGYYHTVNSHLRGLSQGGPSVLRDIRYMDEGMQTTKVPMTVSRGMDREGFGMGHLSNSQIDDLEGLVVRDRGFMSTSIKEVFDNEIRLILEVPPGAKGYWVQPISLHPSEQEFLLNRDTKIMITKVEQTGSGYYKRWKVYGRVIV